MIDSCGTVHFLILKRPCSDFGAFHRSRSLHKRVFLALIFDHVLKVPLVVPAAGAVLVLVTRHARLARLADRKWRLWRPLSQRVETLVIVPANK